MNRSKREFPKGADGGDNPRANRDAIILAIGLIVRGLVFTERGHEILSGIGEISTRFKFTQGMCYLDHSIALHNVSCAKG